MRKDEIFTKIHIQANLKNNDGWIFDRVSTKPAQLLFFFLPQPLKSKNLKQFLEFYEKQGLVPKKALDRSLHK